MEHEKHGRPGRPGRQDKDLHYVFHKLEEIESKIDALGQAGGSPLLAQILTNTEQIMARLDDLEREEGETETAINALTAAFQQLAALLPAAQADAAAAKALAASLQAQVDAGNTELEADSTKAAELAGKLDAKQAEIAAVIASVPPPPTP